MAIVIGYEPKQYIPAPQGLHRAVCVKAEDLGIQTMTFEGKEKELSMVQLSWELDQFMPEDGNNPRQRFLVSRRYRRSLHPRATLRKDLESWRGTAFTDAEVRNLDLEDFVGLNCQLNIIHRDGSYQGQPTTYANVESVLPPAEDQAFVPQGDTASEVQETDSEAATSVTQEPSAEPDEQFEGGDSVPF